MADELAATVESAPTADQAAVDTAPTDAAPQYTDFSKHPDWQRMVGERQSDRQTIQQLRQEMQQLRQASAPKPTAPAPEYVEAGDALLKVLEAHPKLKALLGLMDKAPQYEQGFQHVQGLLEHRNTLTVQAGHEMIRQLAKDLPQEITGSEEGFAALEDLVTGLFTRNPELAQRFLRGDRQAVAEAYAKLDKAFLGPLRKPALTAVQATKDQVRRLPPRAAGGAPGQPAPWKFDPDDPKGSADKLHALAGKRFAEGTRG